MTEGTGKRILVLGGTGFIGTALMRALARDTSFELTWTARPGASGAAIPDAPLPLIYEDLEALDPDVLHRQDIIVDLVSRGRGRTLQSHNITVRVASHFRLIDQLRNRGFQGHFLFLSSGGTVYGVEPSLPCREGDALAPFNDYSLEKAMVELHLGAAERAGLKVSILRVANAYGEGQAAVAGFGVIPTIIGAIKENRPFTVYGDGTAERDYVHIDDIVRAIWLAIRLNGSGIVNIGSGVGTSVRELLDVVSDLSNTPVATTEHPLSTPEPNSIVLDINRARDTLGWSPKVTLREGLTRVLDYEGLLRAPTGD